MSMSMATRGVLTITRADSVQELTAPLRVTLEQPQTMVVVLSKPTVFKVTLLVP